MSNRKKLLTDSIWLSVANYIAYGFAFAGGILLRRMLGPSAYGTYHMLSIVENYSGYTNVGVMRGAEKTVPFLTGKGEHDSKERVARSAVSFVLITSLIAGVLCFLSTFVFSFENVAFKTSLRIFSIAIIFKQIYNILLVLLRAEKRFVFVSKNTIHASVVGLVLTLGLTLLYSLPGCVLGYSLALVWITVYTAARSGIHVGWILDFAVIWDLIKKGMRLMVVTFLYTTFTGMDRLLIVGMVGTADVGYYSIAVMAFSLGLALPSQVGMALWPRLLETYGRTRDRHALRRPFEETTKMLGMATPVYVGMIYLVLPTLVTFLLPKYVEGMDALRLMLFGLAFASVSNVGGQLLITIDMERYLIGVRIVSITVCAGLDYAAIKLGYGINGVALGTSVAYCVDSLLVQWGCMVALEPSWTKRVSFMGRDFGPSTVFAAVLAGAYFVGPRVVPGAFGRETVSWLCYLVLAASLLWLALKNVLIREVAASAGAWVRARLSNG